MHIGEGGAEGKRDKQTRCGAGSPRRGLIPGTQDHSLSLRPTLNQLSQPGVPELFSSSHKFLVLFIFK